MKSKYDKYILPVVNDFDTFINFISEKDPSLSNKTLALGKNDCFELNSQLYFKINAIKASQAQDKYIAIDLFLKLAVNSKLFLIQVNSKNKFKLVRTVFLEEFLNLNIYEKYAFLLECFWTKYEFEEELRNIIYHFTELIFVISKTNVQKKIYISDVNYGSTLFSYYSMFPKMLEIMGICELECIDNVKSRYDDSIKSILPTVFGIEICKVLISTALDYLNVDDYYIDIIKGQYAINDIKVKKTFFELIANIFEPKLINKSINCNSKINREGNYILKVSLDKNLWRIIKLSHKTRLHELHLIIQEAFDFDNDHMYAFYTGTSYRNGKQFYCADPFGESEEYEDLTIEDAEIYKGQQFIYLFDFGDMWEFKIQVMDFIENEDPYSSPQIIESKGESVQQYPY